MNHEAMVQFQGSRYSVPPTFAGQAVWVKAEGGHIRVQCNDTIIAEHRAALKAGQCIVSKEHLAELWKLTLTQINPPLSTAPRWHLLGEQTVQRIPLERFEEVIR